MHNESENTTARHIACGLVVLIAHGYALAISVSSNDMNGDLRLLCLCYYDRPSGIHCVSSNIDDAHHMKARASMLRLVMIASYCSTHFTRRVSNLTFRLFIVAAKFSIERDVAWGWWHHSNIMYWHRFTILWSMHSYSKCILQSITHCELYSKNMRFLLQDVKW